VISLILKGLADSTDPAADWNEDGEYSILDAISLLLYIREQQSGSILASAQQPQVTPLKLTAGQRELLFSELKKCELTDAEWERVYDLLGTEKLPGVFSLGQNRPNPFNPSTVINYEIPGGPAVQVKLEIYNLRGLPVKTLVDELKEPGYYSVGWDSRDEHGRELASGVYLYRLRAGDFSQVRKMVLLK